MEIVPYTPQFPRTAGSTPNLWLTQHSKSVEKLATFLAIGVLLYAAKFYEERVYLTLGVIHFTLPFGLKILNSSSEQNDKQALIEIVRKIGIIIGFINVGLYIGKTIRESRVSAASLPVDGAKLSLFKRVFHAITLLEIQKSVFHGSGPLILPHVVNKDFNKKSIIITAIAILAISATTTYVAPGLNNLLWFAFASTLKATVKGAILETFSLNRFLNVAGIAMILVTFFPIGGTIGQATRLTYDLINHSSSFSLLSTLSICLSTSIHLGTFNFLVSTSFTYLEWIALLSTLITIQTEKKLNILGLNLQICYQELPKFQEYCADNLELYKTYMEKLQEYRGLSYEEFKTVIADLMTQHRDSPVMVDVIGLMNTISYLCVKKNQSVDQSISDMTSFFKDVEAFHKRVTSGLYYTPEKLDKNSSKEEVQKDLEKRIEIVKNLLPKFGWSTIEAGYILLAPFDDDNPENIEHRKHQAYNYKQLSRWFHPDKNGDSEESKEIFQYIEQAKQVLDGLIEQDLD